MGYKRGDAMSRKKLVEIAGRNETMAQYRRTSDWIMLCVMAVLAAVVEAIK